MATITAAILKKNRNTIRAARKAYTRAEKEHAALVKVDDDTGWKMQAADLDKTEEAWGDFLLYSDMVFEKLKYGKRSIDEKWFGEVEATYKSDELLAYLHLARNDLAHGLLDGTRSQKFEQKLERYVVLETKIIDGQKTVVGVPLTDPWTMITPGWVTLRPLQLKDRKAPNGERTVPLPTSHLGEAIVVGTPRAAADVAIKFYADLLAKAEALVEQQAAQPQLFDGAPQRFPL
jgi:hypothetical protein